MTRQMLEFFFPLKFILSYVVFQHLYSYVQEVQHNIDKLTQIHINAVGKK